MDARTPARSRAFTAIEMVVTFAVAAVLLGLTVAGIGAMRQRARWAEAERTVVSADVAARAAFAAIGEWPAEQSGHVLGRRLAEQLGAYGFTPDASLFTTADSSATLRDPWGRAYRYDVADVGGHVAIPGRRTAAFWAARGVEGVRIFSEGPPGGGPDRYVYPPGRDEGASEDWFDDNGFLTAGKLGADGFLAPAARTKLPTPGGGHRRWRR